MARRPREQLEGGFFHCINRAAGRRTIFHDARDYETFLFLMRRALRKFPVELAAYCLMPNHWHMVVMADPASTMSRFYASLLNAHTKWHHTRRDTVGEGPIYQGRFKSYALEGDAVVAACRYVERNPVAANLVASARQWPWSSVGFWSGQEGAEGLKMTRPFYEDPAIWESMVDLPLTAAELDKARGQKGSTKDSGVTEGD